MCYSFSLWLSRIPALWKHWEGGRTNNVGSVNGEDISYQDFSKILDQQRENQKNQTGKDIDEDEMGQFRDQVWDAVVTQKLLEQQIKKYGITVSDQEIKDIILSDNPPDFLKKSFIDSTGKFNDQLYKQALFDPEKQRCINPGRRGCKTTKTHAKTSEHASGGCHG